MDDRINVGALVDAIVPCDVIESDHKSDTLRWVASDAVLYRYQRPAQPPKHLVAYFVLVDAAHDALLLVDHRNAKRWLPTGGHVEPGEDPRATVRRELVEELGIAADLVDGLSSNPLFITQTTTVGIDAGHTDVSLWYVLHGSTAASLRPDEIEFAAVRWWTFDEISSAPSDIFDPHFLRFVYKLRRELASIGPEQTGSAP